MEKIYRLLIIIAFINFIYSCKNEPKTQITENKKGEKVELKYAQGFSITKFDTHTTLEISSPWPNSELSFKHEFLKENLPVKKIVVTSTTHIPALELLEVEQALVGFPGTDYISSKNTRALIDNDHVRELGKNEGINTEVLLELQPDVVIGFGVDGTNKTFETLKKSGIEVIYNGDWVESSALAKAEWIKFFGVLFNKETKADSIFNTIEANYLEAKKIAKSVTNQPSILSGAMHKDVWYLPNGASPEAQFLKDANVNYLWKDTNSKGSLALSFESVFEKAINADIWLSPSYYTSLSQLEEANSHYNQFSAFKNKKVYSFSNTTGATGGVLYYELGTARPDLVLKDIIKICHPHLLNNYQPYFFQALE